MPTLLLLLAFASANTIDRLQTRCTEMLDRANESSFGSEVLAVTLRHRPFTFQPVGEARLPLAPLVCHAFDLACETRWHAADLLFSFTGEGARLRLVAHSNLDPVGDRGLDVDGKTFGIVNLLEVVELIATYNGIDDERTLERNAARMIKRNLRASVPLTQVGRHGLTLLFHVFELGREWTIGPRIELTLARPCPIEREGENILLTEQGNVCLIKLGELTAAGAATP